MANITTRAQRKEERMSFWEIFCIGGGAYLVGIWTGPLVGRAVARFWKRRG